MRYIYFVTLLLTITFLSYAQQKAAIIIGNNNYKEYPLKNATNDADLMAKVLTQLGFSVQLVKNATKSSVENELKSFIKQYKNADIRFFYYAGHGIQFEGENYLIPLDATLDDKVNVRLEGINFNTIFSMLQSSRDSALNIFVLDACRNNPFKNRSWGNRDIGNDRGLRLRKADFTTGSYAAFSADYGQTASDGDKGNGLYTSILAEEMLKPGVEINILFQRVRSRVSQLSKGEQLPIEENRLVGEGFYFIPQQDNPKPMPNPKPVPPPNPIPNPTPTPVENNITRQLELASINFNAKNYLAAYEIYQKMRDKDFDNHAKLNLGSMFAYGLGTRKNTKKAKKYLEEAANSGYSPAMVSLGIAYSNGNAFPIKSSQAIYWYQRAIDAGDANAANNLGVLYLDGRSDLAPNYTMAKYFLEESIKKNSANSGGMFRLGDIYKLGLGVLQDINQAKYWYQKACNLGNSVACTALQNLSNRGNINIYNLPGYYSAGIYHFIYNGSDYHFDSFENACNAMKILGITPVLAIEGSDLWYNHLQNGLKGVYYYNNPFGGAPYYFYTKEDALNDLYSRGLIFTGNNGIGYRSIR